MCLLQCQEEVALPRTELLSRNGRHWGKKQKQKPNKNKNKTHSAFQLQLMVTFGLISVKEFIQKRACSQQPVRSLANSSSGGGEACLKKCQKRREKRKKVKFFGFCCIPPALFLEQATQDFNTHTHTHTLELDCPCLLANSPQAMAMEPH